MYRDLTQDELVELFASKVHGAWMEQKRLRGVTSRKSEKGEELMVPYADLTEESKDLDRGSVRAVMQAVYDSGYRLARF